MFSWDVRHTTISVARQHIFGWPQLTTTCRCDIGVEASSLSEHHHSAEFSPFFLLDSDQALSAARGGWCPTHCTIGAVVQWRALCGHSEVGCRLLTSKEGAEGLSEFESDHDRPRIWWCSASSSATLSHYHQCSLCTSCSLCRYSDLPLTTVLPLRTSTPSVSLLVNLAQPHWLLATMRFVLLILVMCSAGVGSSSAVDILGRPRTVPTTQFDTGGVSIQYVTLRMSGIGSILFNALSSSGSVIHTMLRNIAAPTQFNWTLPTPNACVSIKFMAMRGSLNLDGMDIYTQGQF
jgi:hypothetical protein